MSAADRLPLDDQTAAPSANSGVKALNQSHWRAVETLIEGVREGRSVMVLCGAPGAGASAVVREALGALPRRYLVVESGPQAATLDEVIAPLHQALRLDGGAAPETRAEAVREALEARADQDAGVVYVLDPEDAPTEDALVYLARLAAGGRRLTRERLEPADGRKPLRGPVGAQIVLCAPPEALEALAALGDGAMRRAAETPIEIQPFDEPALRAAFRQCTGAALSPGGARYLLAATGGAQADVEELLAHPVLCRFADAPRDETTSITAQMAARCVEALGWTAPDLCAEALDAADIRAEARGGATPDSETSQDEAAAPIDVALESQPAETPELPDGAPAPLAEEESPAMAAPSMEIVGETLDGAAALEALDEALIDAMLEEDLSGEAEPAETEAQPDVAASAGGRSPEDEEAALRDALDAAEASLAEPHPAVAEGESAPGAVDRMLQAMGLRRRASAAERLRLQAAAPSKTLGASRRGVQLAAGAAVLALVALGVFAARGGSVQDMLERLADGRAEARFETGDTSRTGEENSEDAAGPILSSLVGDALSAAENASRAAAETFAPTEGAARQLKRFADDIFVARGDLNRGRMTEELAALPPAERDARRDAVIVAALRRSEAHAAAGRFTSPEGANAYEALLAVYPLAPRDPRVRGALSALVRHYDAKAQRALEEQRYERFHESNRIADRIRARMPI